tara:strand:- start:25798 stop:28113 length:2316 start_codon:yes stop_codon:yes gene_type:complete
MKKRAILTLVLILLLVIALATAATRTFYVEETDFVKVNPISVDLDFDKVTYTFSEPLDEKGEWQTTFDDAGEYEVSITASDGVDESVESVNIIVKNKNQAPYLEEKNIVVKETQVVDLKSIVKDPDDDPLKFSFPAPFDSSGMWLTSFADEGDYFVEFTVSDGQLSTKARVNIEVLPTNEPPIVVEVFSSAEEIELKESETLDYFVEGKDNDGDEIVYLWKFNNRVINTESKGSLELDFSSAGKYLLELTLDDGVSQTQQVWKVSVENKNREPVFTVPSITVNEAGKVSLNLSTTDLDGDILSYSFEEPLDINGEWQTTFDDAGNYSILVEADDGDLSSSTLVEIYVKDVDRAPLIVIPEKLEVKEGEEVLWQVNVNDPDGDHVDVSIQGAPEGALLDKQTNTFSWSPDFDFIHRREGFISNVLNSLRLENKFLKFKKTKLTVKACGKALCTSAPLDLVTYNVNRRPIFAENEIVIVNETQELKLPVKADDPDGDIVKYFYPKPLTRRGGTWKTTFDDEGNYTFYVSASDGSLESTHPVKVLVKKSNRKPSVSVSTEKVLVNEGEEFTIHVEGKDPDNDELDVTLDFLPFGAEFKDGVFVWTPNFNNIQNKTDSLKNTLVKDSAYLNRRFNSEKQVYWITFTADDGEVSVKQPVKIIVKNKNRKPVLVDVIPEKVVAKINEPVIFQVLAGDQDDDDLEYKWNFGFGETSVVGTNTIERVFVAPGDKKVEVEISDGRDTIVKKWDVKVVNEVFKEPEEPFSFGNVRVYVVDV